VITGGRSSEMASTRHPDTQNSDRPRLLAIEALEWMFPVSDKPIRPAGLASRDPRWSTFMERRLPGSRSELGTDQTPVSGFVNQTAGLFNMNLSIAKQFYFLGEGAQWGSSARGSTPF